MTKLLIVEDDVFYRKLYKHKFQISGYEVMVAENGKEGLELVRSFKPDLILMDIMMPVMSGYEALDQIKAEAELKDLPVIMLTNLASEADTSLATQKGALGFIIKSDLTPEQLIERVEEMASLQKG